MKPKTPPLVELHGQLLTTTSEIIANNCKVQHEATIKLVRKFLHDLQEVGQVRFEIRPNRHIQNREIAILDDYATMLLLTHMRSNEVVSRFKKELVHEFKRMKAILLEPNRKQNIKHKRDTAKPMTDMLQFVRETEGKATNSNHFGNEHLFCNRALTGKWQTLDESTLDEYDIKLLSKIREYNTLLITRHLKQADRKAMLDSFVANYRSKHPRIGLAA